MNEISNPRTNVEHMINAAIRAGKEEMTVLKNGDPNTNGFIVVHNDIGYVVRTDRNGEVASCTCPHHTFRNVICKHMIKVALENGLSVADLPDVTGKEVKYENNKVKILKAE
jgi:hypothetical protein